jgi:hypothetical protein
MLRAVSGESADRPPEGGERGVTEALRSAIQRTLEATARPETRERAADLLDEVARRGRGVRDEVARRGQEAGAELAKRGQEARDELAKQLEALEARLASIEEALRGQERRADSEDADSNPEAEH